MSIDRPFTRTAVRRAVHAAAARPLATTAATTLTLLALAPASALAAAAAKATGDDAPLDLGDDASQPQVGAGGGGIARVAVGLLVVVGVIYGVTWLLKQVKTGKEAPTGTGLQAVTTMPLQGGAALSLVKVGDELLLVGSGQNGATALRRYEEDEARALGLWPAETPEDDGPAGGGGTGNVVSVLGRTISTMRARTTREPEVVQHASTAGQAPVAPVTYAAPGTAPAPAAPPAPVAAPRSAAPSTVASRLLDRARAMTVRR